MNDSDTSIVQRDPWAVLITTLTLVLLGVASVVDIWRLSPRSVLSGADCARCLHDDLWLLPWILPPYLLLAVIAWCLRRRTVSSVVVLLGTLAIAGPMTAIVWGLSVATGLDVGVGYLFILLSVLQWLLVVIVAFVGSRFLREADRIATVRALWLQRPSETRTRNDVLPFHSELEESWPYLLKRSHPDKYQQLRVELADYFTKSG